ncbi:uncharacterized protein LOC127102218 [Lathyrus oleraceus]|uniref:uncharacterized protein LOC127102218 n=1 Tax=Pisum sativum TaxID=3888 RepID=UPI0021CF313E|nr:uncharacterized protein LOC127102218 [Pisum sativum]
MVFTTRVKESSNFELLNNDVFPDNNENVSDDDLSNDALVESYKTPYVKSGLKNPKLLKGGRKGLKCTSKTKGVIDLKLEVSKIRLEDIVAAEVEKKLKAMNIENRNNYKNNTASIKNLEVQLGQIAQQIASSQTPGSLLSRTVQNPRDQENVNTVTTKKKRAAKKEKVIPPEKPTEEKNKKDTKTVIKLPYPQRVTKKEPSKSDYEKFMTMFKKVEGHVSLFEALERMPMYNGKEVIFEKKPKAEELVALREKSSVNSLEQKILNKQKDPGTVTISCTIKERTFKRVLIDSGASVSLMPLSIYHMLGIKNVSDTKTNLKFTDHSRKDGYGIEEYVLVTIEDLSFHIDFVILDIPEDEETPIILGRPFMQTSRCNLDMDQGTLTLKVYDKEITLNFVEYQELEVEIEHHYQVGLIKIEARRQINIPTSEKDTRRHS